MLTEEQIKNLKEGDSLQLDVVFSADVDHEILIKAPTEDGHWLSDVFSPAILSLPPSPPKHDPCRKFRKGDIVRLREYNGRKPYDYLHKQVIKNFGAKLDTVLEDELDSGNVYIFQNAPIDELTVWVNSCHLELVTPVEERDKYIVRETNLCFSVCKRNEFLDSSACFNKKHPLAREHAEKYCAALNAEYRKEQK